MCAFPSHFYSGGIVYVAFMNDRESNSALAMQHWSLSLICQQPQF